MTQQEWLDIVNDPNASDFHKEHALAQYLLPIVKQYAGNLNGLRAALLDEYQKIGKPEIDRVKVAQALLGAYGAALDMNLSNVQNFKSVWQQLRDNQ